MTASTPPGWRATHRADLIALTRDDVGDTEGAQVVLILGQGRRDDSRAGRGEELHRDGPHTAGGAGDQHRLAGFYGDGLDGGDGRGGGHADSAGNLDTDGVGALAQVRRRDDDLFGPRARMDVRPHRGHHPEYLVAERETDNSVADRLHGAGEVPAEREGVDVRGVGLEHPGDNRSVDRIDRRRADADQHFAVARCGRLKVGAQDRGGVVVFDRDGLHEVSFARGSKGIKEITTHSDRQL